ncbi:MAG: peptide chain release factor 1 [Candidatus Sumerlaeia bacterium]|nr:peptide chain release factor 1 [Candidatus Sumerlaeia bacterium]
MAPTPETPTSRRLEQLLHRFHALEGQLADPTLSSDSRRMAEVGKEHNELSETIQLARKVLDAESRLAQALELLATESDPEMRELAEMDRGEAEIQVKELSEALEYRLLPKDPLDDRNILMEFRAGTGGDEAGLFAMDLLKMYSRYAELMGWRTELMTISETELGGLREAVLSIKGDRAYSYLKFESGVHRVQRVPATETQGRIHTSAATVAVLPEAEESDIEIRESDLRIDTMCASGPGGQGVNTTYSAVRIVHIPTGVIVTCQDERSQIKNKAKAMSVLRARLLEEQIRKDNEARSANRKQMVGSGDRSERIRTYNFPQNRLTDHRINLTVYNLENVMQGQLEAVINALRKEELAEKLAQLAK